MAGHEDKGNKSTQEQRFDEIETELFEDFIERDEKVEEPLKGKERSRMIGID